MSGYFSTPTVSQSLLQSEEYDIVRIGKDRLETVSAFVYNVYADLFSRLHGWQADSLSDFIAEDLSWADQSATFAACQPGSGDLLATFRVIDRTDRPLPVEQELGLDIATDLRTKGQTAARICEGGRFARRRSPLDREESGKKRMSRAVQAVMSSAAMYCAITPGTVVYAIADVNILKILQRRGFMIEQIGPPRFYVGSPSAPICIHMDEWMKNRAA